MKYEPPEIIDIQTQMNKGHSWGSSVCAGGCCPAHCTNCASGSCPEGPCGKGTLVMQCDTDVCCASGYSPTICCAAGSTVYVPTTCTEPY